MALWIQVKDGLLISKHVTPANGRAFTLEEMQRYVGGYIEALYLDTGQIMWLNEDGKAMELPYNPAASLYAHEHSGIAPWDQIVGNVLIASLAESDEDEAYEAEP